MSQVEGVGPVMAEAFTQWFKDEGNRNALDELLKQITIEKTMQSASSE